MVLILHVCASASAKALIRDVYMEVPAGFTTEADDCVPYSFQFSLSLIYYFIYNPSTANLFRPMGSP